MPARYDDVATSPSADEHELETAHRGTRLPRSGLALFELIPANAGKPLARLRE